MSDPAFRRDAAASRFDKTFVSMRYIRERLLGRCLATEN
jgi:hypothetical protein